MSVTIELTAPQSVNGKRASYQSIWLLVRLAYARRHEAATRGVRLADLRRQFTDARTLRMFVSRAFRDFTQWGVLVGWGEDVHADPRFLNPDRRSQGPFWLPPGEDEKIDCLVDGKPAAQRELLRFLDIRRQPDAVPAAPIVVAPDYWLALAGAQQQMREGRLLAAIAAGAQRCDNGALAGFKRAARASGNRLQHALAVLGEAQVWRRLDDLEAARKTLIRLRRMLPLSRSGPSMRHNRRLPISAWRYGCSPPKAWVRYARRAACKRMRCAGWCSANGSANAPAPLGSLPGMPSI
jgi:hypothetical protein